MCPDVTEKQKEQAWILFVMILVGIIVCAVTVAAMKMAFDGPSSFNQIG